MAPPRTSPLGWVAVRSPSSWWRSGHRSSGSASSTGYTTTDGEYRTYLRELGAVFRSVAALLRPGGHAVLNVANIVTGDTVTPLAWDVAERVPAHLTLRQDVFLCWDEQPPGLSGDYCLVFRKAG